MGDGMSVREMLIRMEGKIDLLVAAKDVMLETDDDHEKRLRILEGARWPIPSLALVVSLAAIVSSRIQ
jgi:hypothetical protein